MKKKADVREKKEADVMEKKADMREKKEVDWEENADSNGGG